MIPFPPVTKEQQGYLEMIEIASVPPLNMVTLRCLPELRWRVPTGTTTADPILEQAWQDIYTLKTYWKPVPTVVQDSP